MHVGLGRRVPPAAIRTQSGAGAGPVLIGLATGDVAPDRPSWHAPGLASAVAVPPGNYHARALRFLSEVPLRRQFRQFPDQWALLSPRDARGNCSGGVALGCSYHRAGNPTLFLDRYGD
ncbi:hypothetical protein B1987_20350 [Mycobacterium kansasii]|nr:hypothetical protein B1987_20350 [Mycobacterium kansasii]